MNIWVFVGVCVARPTRLQGASLAHSSRWWMRLCASARHEAAKRYALAALCAPTPSKLCPERNREDTGRTYSCVGFEHIVTEYILLETAVSDI